MAYSHFEVDETLKPARDLMDTLRKLRQAWVDFAAVRGCLIQQQDSSTDFTSIAANYGYAGADAAAKETAAQASFAEMDSAFAGNAAITQMLDRHLWK